MKEKLPLEQYIDTISHEFENSTKKIMAIEYHYDLEKIFSISDNLSLKEKYSLYEALINDYLKKIKSLKNHPSMNDIAKDINDITEFYDYTYGVDDQKEESTLYEAMEEADDIVDDLYLKLIGVNGRNLKLPIKLDDIINLQIRGIINSDDIEKVIYWVILKLSVLYNYLSSK
ncbi:MAG TPA: hypothetical protein IAB35_05620 [Candidatus Faecimonas gallistercoris]|nr:hypothetical protein [Candidatus Faecimonas gallistercoris]